MAHKYLSLEWFKSKIDKVVTSSIEKISTSKIEKLVDDQLNTLQEHYEEEGSNIGSDFDLDSRVNDIEVFYIINNILTIYLKSGQVISKNHATQEEIKYLQDESADRSEKTILDLFTSENIKNKREEEKQKRKEEEKELNLVKSNFNILIETGDFIEKNDSIYLKGIEERSIPKLLIKEFANTLEKYHLTNSKLYEIKYNGLKKFWLKCCLNPNSQSSEDLYGFLEKHNMKIDKHGNFYTYRRVVTVSSGDTKLVDFISNSYNKVKAVWRKHTNKYYVIKNSETNELFLSKKIDKKGENLGNLETLYKNLPLLKENRYTDAHTRKQDYRVGQIHSMPRYEGNDDNTRSCSTGFHQASKEYDYSYFGDQNILCIVNPISVLAVPHNEYGKLRVCDWFFAMTLTEEEKHILDEDCFDVQELGDIFEDKFNVNLEERVKNGISEEVQRHTFNLAPITSNEIKKILKSLDEIKVTIADRVIKKK